MHITAVMVMSVNGRITNGNQSDPRTWSSEEDKAQFSQMIKDKKLLIMGAGTYEAPQSKRGASDDGRFRVVLTSDPSKYASEAVPNKLEFMSGDVKSIVQQLEARGFNEALLLGGAATNRDFFAAGLVSELRLTVEPKLFGSGKPIIEEGQFTANMKLIEQKQLNDQGTMLLRYKIDQ